jgi:hypothetical protein
LSNPFDEISRGDSFCIRYLADPPQSLIKRPF